MVLQLGSEGRPAACGGEEKGDDEDLEGRPAFALGRKAGPGEEKSSSHSKPPPVESFEERFSGKEERPHLWWP